MSTKETQLTQIKAKALKAYSQKDYATSTELYAEACELQSAIQGENNPQNAHLLYLYGRSLFEVALKKSDVLGGVAQEETKPKEEKKRKNKDKLEAPASGAEAVIGEKALEKGAPVAKPGLFSFTGDENWDDSDEEFEDEEEGEGEGEAKEEEEDDFTLAWEILDYARVLFLKQLSPDTSDVDAGVKSDILPVESTTTNTFIEPITSIPNEEKVEEKTEEKKEEKTEEKIEVKEKANEEVKAEEKEEKEVSEPAEPVTHPEDETKALLIALADTYDLLGEVSLESESFEQAAKDLRSSLDLKLQLYPLDSTLISEGHYKLSLALEFAAAGEELSESARLKGREEAAIEMEKAITSCKARIEKEEKQISISSGDDKGKGKEQVTKSLADAKEMVEELETRLADLRTTSPSPAETAMDPLRGILGQVLGEDQATAKKRIEEAISGARDLTGLVRKKQPASTPVNITPVAVGTTKPTENGNSKRKLDDLQEEEEPVVEDTKKAKVSDSEEV